MNSKDIYCVINLRHLTVKQIRSIERERERAREGLRERWTVIESYTYC